MPRCVGMIEVTKLDPLMQPSFGVHTFPIPEVDTTVVTLQYVLVLLQKLGVEESGTSFQLFYKHGEDYIIPDVNMAEWPECSCDGDRFKVWYRLLPSGGCSCFGVHVHYRNDQRYKQMTPKQYKGYVLLQAVADGCLDCMATLLDERVDPNFGSLNKNFTPVDWARYQLSEGKITQQRCDDMLVLLKRYGVVTHV
jgi:hypothetical protein